MRSNPGTRIFGGWIWWWDFVADMVEDKAWPRRFWRWRLRRLDRMHGYTPLDPDDD